MARKPQKYNKINRIRGVPETLFHCQIMDKGSGGPHNLDVSDRLDRFRQYMANLDVSTSVHHREFYVKPPGQSVADDLAARLEINPRSSHIVLGGIGTGKTTQLILACQRLNALLDTSAVYVDISKEGSLDDLDFQSLSRAIGAQIQQYLDAGGSQSMLAIRAGFRRIFEADVDPLADSSQPPQASLKQLSQELDQMTPHSIVVLDSLDRLLDLRAYAEIVTNVLPRMRELGIGVIATGPLHLLYGTARTVLDRVDRFHLLSSVDPDAKSVTGITYLTRIVHARIPEEVCPMDVCCRLAIWSGGVLRDLIALTQSALEEAYISGSDSITDNHVDMAADSFGRKHMLGLNRDEIRVLGDVQASGDFVPTSDSDLALLHTRRILEYRGSQTRYAVHPTIAPLLELLKAA